MNLESVMATNDDASSCKRSAVHLGYWCDPYISCFTRQFRRRPPEINLGYYARVRGIERLIDWFIREHSSADNVQLVSLGAGFDTLYWRLRHNGLNLAAFVEIDLQPVVERKIRAIRQNKQLSSVFQRDDSEVVMTADNTSLHAGEYHLIAGDISQCEHVLPSIFSQCHLSADSPTIVLSECVLVYIASDSGSKLLKYLADYLSRAVFINYEMVFLNDRFGEVLVDNLHARGCQLAGVTACMSQQSQINRFKNCGWQHVRIWTMDAVLDLLPREDVERVRKLELLDDVSLLHQLLSHYGICVACKHTSLTASALDLINFS